MAARGATMIAVTAAVLGCSAADAGCALSMFRSRAAGSVAAQGTKMGSFAGRMAICESGARSFFLGVDIASADKTVLMRIIQYPNPGRGAAIILMRQSSKNGLELTRKNCSKLDVRVRPTNVRINGIRVMQGHAAFECKLHSGGTVRGDLRFENCH